MLLETLLKEKGPGEITNIFFRSNMAFFKLHNESFCTAAGHVAHQSSPMYDSGAMHAFAAQAHDEKTIKETEAYHEECDRNNELWDKHRTTCLKMLFTMSLQILNEKGEDAFVKFVDSQFEIYPEGAMELVNRLEEES